MIALAGLVFALSIAASALQISRLVAANPASRVPFLVGRTHARPRWHTTLGTLTVAFAVVAGAILAHTDAPLWVGFLAYAVLLAVIAVPIWNHNGQVKYGDGW